MSLAQRLAEAPAPSRGGRPCALCVALEGMPAEDVQAVADAMADPGCTDPWLAEQLQAEGYTAVTKSTVGNHRRGRHRP